MPGTRFSWLVALACSALLGEQARATTASVFAMTGRDLITSGEKVYFAEHGETKADLAEHYLRVAEPLMRTMGGRPVLLQRFPEGASGPQIAEAMGWAPHTVRGFLAGLAKKGMAVEVVERVRQVGPNKQGAKGSYTIYRLGSKRQP